MLERLLYWFKTHTMHPFSWPYVLFESAHHKIEDALAQKGADIVVSKTMVVCHFCGFDQFTEQGLCEKCGKAAIFFGP